MLNLLRDGTDGRAGRDGRDGRTGGPDETDGPDGRKYSFTVLLGRRNIVYISTGTEKYTVDFYWGRTNTVLQYYLLFIL